MLISFLFTDGFTLMWDWDEANVFDVDTSSTQTMYSQYMRSILTDGENTGKLYVTVCPACIWYIQH